MYYMQRAITRIVPLLLGEYT